MGGGGGSGLPHRSSLPAGLPATTIYLMGLILLPFNEFRGVYPTGREGSGEEERKGGMERMRKRRGRGDGEESGREGRKQAGKKESDVKDG